MLFFIESSRTGTGLTHVQWALDHGHEVAFVSADPARYDSPAEREVVELLERRGRVLRADTTDGPLPEGLPAGPGHGVVCVSDRFLDFAARLAQRVGAPFAAPEALAVLRDKRRARELYEELGLPQVAWRPLGSAEDAEGFAREVGGPVVIKNVCGTGSLDVVQCGTPRDAARAYGELWSGQRYLDAELMAEEFLRGPLYSIETMLIDGQCHPLGTTDRQLGPAPHFCEVSYTFPADLPAAVTAAMEQAVAAVAARLELRWGLVHTEFIVGSDGPRLVEVNPRLAGGLLPAMMSDCLETTTSELLCSLALGQKPRTPVRRDVASSTVTVYQAQAGTVAEVETADAARCPFVVDVTSVARPGAAVGPPRDYRGAACQIRTTAPTPGLAQNAALAAARQVRVRLADAQP